MTLQIIRNYLHSVLQVIVGFLVFSSIVLNSSDDMAASFRQYNLRSAGQGTVEVPVELHMSEDNTFMKELLVSQQEPTTGQVSDNDSSIHESDCEALIASSDDDNDSRQQVVNRHKSVKKSDPIALDSQSTSQEAINIQILAQLQSFGKRLHDMEKRSSKKSTDTTKIKNKSYKSKSELNQRSHPPLFTMMLMYMTYIL